LKSFKIIDFEPLGLYNPKNNLKNEKSNEEIKFYIKNSNIYINNKKEIIITHNEFNN
jgi:hypothetical protein